MSDLVAIRTEKLGKKYRVAHRQNRAQYSALRDVIAEKAKAFLRNPLGLIHPSESIEQFWALKDVSIQIKEGEVVGVIGRNGAGKSTFLKVLSRITEPTEGSVRIMGRVASLLEVGTGFHPELTGRENIFLNGAILGMKRAEIKRKFDEIVAFAEVEKFLDTPVKWYSSGMYVRLAFAVAAHLEPEILIVDEVLAVGDAQFQKKCLGKMQSASRQEGRTVLFVSHNMAAIRALCGRLLVLNHGCLRNDTTDIDAGVQSYLQEHLAMNGSTWAASARDPKKQIQLTSVAVYRNGEQPRHRVVFDIELASQSSHRDAFLAIDFQTPQGDTIMQAIPSLRPFLPGVSLGTHHCKVEVELPPLVPGQYTASIWVGDHFSSTLDFVRSCVAFEIGHSPCSERTFPFSSDHGYIVPNARVIDNRSGV
jgi:lipopolysaccharide transport system ATP-binding protein